MTIPPILDGITERTITTDRLTTRVLFAGDESGIPVVFVHGNASSATYWEETMLALPAGYYGVAPDQRSYGGADPAVKVDATRGMGDFADDLAALMDTLEIERAHVVGHSLGGSVLWRFMADYPRRVRSVTMAAPGSPHGFGGCVGLEGKLAFPDGAGSGGGVVNPDFAQQMAAGNTDDGEGTPRFIMNTFYWKPPFKPEREDALLLSLLSQHTGEQDYPGDSVPSENFPGAAPGKYGPANALSPLYAQDVQKLYQIEEKPPVLWIRGADDQIVADNSLFDIATLGAMGAVPGYPGEDAYPPQPMVSQTRAVLDHYADIGGAYDEVVFNDCAHTPYIEKPDEFNALFHKHIEAN